MQSTSMINFSYTNAHIERGGTLLPLPDPCRGPFTFICASWECWLVLFYEELHGRQQLTRAGKLAQSAARREQLVPRNGERARILQATWFACPNFTATCTFHSQLPSAIVQGHLLATVDQAPIAAWMLIITPRVICNSVLVENNWIAEDALEISYNMKTAWELVLLLVTHRWSPGPECNGEYFSNIIGIQALASRGISTTYLRRFSCLLQVNQWHWNNPPGMQSCSWSRRSYGY